MKAAYALLVWCIALNNVSAQTAESFLPPEPIPIHAWIGPPDGETTVERYRELKDAGFTHSFSGFLDNDAMEAALDIAGNCGIKLFVSTPVLRKDPEGTVGRFKDHPALAGYHLRDEPNAKDFADLAAWTKTIRALDDEHFCYINLFPNYASSEQLGTATYLEHVERFVGEVPVQVLTFDFYPIVGDKLRPQWYENLEIISQAARDAGKPFWAFALAVAHGPYPIPTLSHLRLQVYSDLAYGAQGIQYFTYWTPKSTRWNFHEGPIRIDGSRSRVYDLVSYLNREIQALSGVFNGSRVVSIGHTGAAIPQGTRRFEAMPPFYTLETKGEGCLVSLLEKDSTSFLAIVNRSLRDNAKVSVTADIAADVQRVMKDGAIRPLDVLGTAFELEPGDIALFMWKSY